MAAGSVPGAVASAIQIESRSLPLPVLTRMRNCKPLQIKKTKGGTDSRLFHPWLR